MHASIEFQLKPKYYSRTIMLLYIFFTSLFPLSFLQATCQRGFAVFRFPLHVTFPAVYGALPGSVTAVVAAETLSPASVAQCYRIHFVNEDAQLPA